MRNVCANVGRYAALIRFIPTGNAFKNCSTVKTLNYFRGIHGKLTVFGRQWVNSVIYLCMNGSFVALQNTYQNGDNE